MKILVTGGAGFIGSHIVDEYIKLGHEVGVVDNLSSGKKSQLNPKAKFFKADIRDKKIGKIFASFKPEVVNHHAAQKDVRVSVADPVLDADINILGGLNLMENCLAHKVKQFIFASTGGAIYGEAERVPTPDDYETHPVSPYGVAKLALEHYLHYYHAVRELPYVGLRYANVYGPRQDASGEGGVVAIFAQKMVRGDKVTINGDGKQTRDFIYVKDVVNANVLALGEKQCGSYNVGTGREISVNELFKVLSTVTGYSKKPTHGPAKVGEQKRSSLSCEKIKLTMGWQPFYDLEEGLKETAWHYKEIK